MPALSPQEWLLVAALGLILLGLLDRIRLVRRLVGLRELERESALVEQRLATDSQALKQQDLECQQLRGEREALRIELKGLETLLEAERQQNVQRLADLQGAREQLTQEFKVLANEILEEKSKRFTEQNETQLRGLLDPLRDRIKEFQGKVEEVYVHEGQERSRLAEQVKQLMGLNLQLSSDATQLTQALKGQSKVQGQWGELVLSRLLDAAGLVEGIHYQTQLSLVREDGSRAQPDVVLKLPEGRELVIDAKVSLTAYEAWSHSEEEPVRKTELKRHLDSIRAHVKGLSARDYQALYQLESLDFVIMFVPVEPAFHLAISADDTLWEEAWEKNVLIVSSSTLLFVVRTLAHLWRQEKQSQNAQEIARRGGELYDKLCGFVQDLEGIGKSLMQAHQSHEQAMKKLATGRGSVLRRAEGLRQLGVKASRQLPKGVLQTLEIAEEEDLPERESLSDRHAPLE